MTASTGLFDKAVSVPAHVHVREVDGELVILSLESEEYYGLDPVGTRVWHHLQSQPTVKAALEVMLEEYDVDQATLGRDMRVLIDELSSRHLVELVEPRASQRQA